MNTSPSASKIQIIIVDDDQLVRDFAVHTIEYGINRKVVTFEDGFNAWQFLKNQADDADIIIADANIPDMDGLELLNQIKKHFPDKKFVLTTSNPDLENTAYQLGADAFLSKPYDVNDLFTIVQQFINQPKSTKDAEDNKMPKIAPSSNKESPDE